MRRSAHVLGAVATTVMALGVRASAALADAEPPPPDAATPSNTGTLVIVALSVAAIVLVSVVVLRAISRRRRERWIEDEYQTRRSSRNAAAEPGASAGPPEDAP
jgi:hypothetical protein